MSYTDLLSYFRTPCAIARSPPRRILPPHTLPTSRPPSSKMPWQTFRLLFRDATVRFFQNRRHGTRAAATLTHLEVSRRHLRSSSGTIPIGRHFHGQSRRQEKQTRTLRVIANCRKTATAMLI